MAFVCTCTLAIDAPGGFLFEWWSVFWDIFIARTNEKHSEPAASYIEVGLPVLNIYIYISSSSFLNFFWVGEGVVLKVSRQFFESANHFSYSNHILATEFKFSFG